MRVLIACEESGIVRDAFIQAGHTAISCDLLPTRKPGPHITGSILHLPMKMITGFDLVIAHPPCTAIAVSGNRYYAGTKERDLGVLFVETIWDWPVDKLAIENPVGVINSYSDVMPRPYYIQPYEFGHDASKKTGLWTRGLPKLEPTKMVSPRFYGGKSRWANQTDSGQNRLTPSPTRQRERSETYQGIADAMANQWGKL